MNKPISKLATGVVLLIVALVVIGRKQEEAASDKSVSSQLANSSTETTAPSDLANKDQTNTAIKTVGSQESSTRRNDNIQVEVDPGSDAPETTPLSALQAVRVSSLDDDASALAPAQQRIQWPIDAEGIRAAVADSLPQIRECYEEWLKTNDAIKGKVKVQFTIELDESPEALQKNRGKITAVEIKDSTLKHKLLEGCVGSVMGDLKFDAPQNGKTTVSYPIEFQPHD